ncbi:MAG: hypothetical protein ACLS8R_08920 [Anaeromassilibacillus sp.]
MGVPVIGIGVPTVVDAGTLAADLLGRRPQRQVSPRGASMVVTPREIDLLITRAARMVAMAINTALNPTLSRRGVFHPRKLSGKNRLSAITVCLPLHLTFFKASPQGLDSHGPAYT